MASTNAEASPTLPATVLPSFFHHLPPLLPFHSWFSSESGMDHDSGVQFVAARSRKRDHRQMSESHGRHAWLQDAEASSSSAHPTQPPSPPPARYPGDGLDYRRPTHSSSQEGSVIDLTNEPDSPPEIRHSQSIESRPNTRRPRPPRFGREIMTEVVDLEEESDPSIQNDPPSSPEVQFVGSSVRSQPPRDLGFGSSLLHMFHLPDPRIRHVSNRNVVRQELARRARARRMNQRPHDVDTFLLGGPGTAVDFAINLDGDGPLHLDFPLQDFPLQGLTPDRGPPPSSYKPPSPAPEGFTRTAGEDDVVCCPNCDAELGTGDETKQQIWVAKQCGHVYCGECATHRSKSNAKKVMQNTKPFSKCQAADCGKSVSAPRSMFQIYL